MNSVSYSDSRIINLESLAFCALAIAFVLGTARVSEGACPGPIEFHYTGDLGPGFWGDLDPSTAACSANLTQSPIDIGKASKDVLLTPLALALLDTPIHLINNGHTIEQEYEAGSTLMFEGVSYNLLQFHFHTFSEHTVKGRRAPMELHAVFQDPISMNLAVVGMLYRAKKETDASAFLTELIATPLPTSECAENILATDINLADALSDTSRYYTYQGSLTTPPCSPIVTWIVLRKQARAAPSQVRAFSDIMGNNFRPIQALNGRTIRKR